MESPYFGNQQQAQLSFINSRKGDHILSKSLEIQFVSRKDREY